MQENVSGVILAGGEGSRMHNQNKGLVHLNGEPLIAHVIKRLSSQVDDIVISANRDVNIFSQYGYPVVQDSSKSRGPLSGILNAGKKTQHGQVFVTACDMPFIPLNVVHELQLSFNGMATAASLNHKIEPLVCLVSREAILQIEDHLRGGNYSVQSWLKACGANVREFLQVDEKAFLSVNSIEDRDSLESDGQASK